MYLPPFAVQTFPFRTKTGSFHVARLFRLDPSSHRPAAGLHSHPLPPQWCYVIPTRRDHPSLFGSFILALPVVFKAV